MITNIYGDVFDRLCNIYRNFLQANISDIGCYELKYEDINKVVSNNQALQETADLLFKQIDEQTALSRNYVYYDFDNLYLNIESVVEFLIETINTYNVDKKVGYLLSALLDYYENYQLTFWYLLYEKSIDNDDNQTVFRKRCDEIFDGISEIVKTHLYVFEGENIDCEHAISEIKKWSVLIKRYRECAEKVEKLDFRLFREFDNRFKCIKEIIYSLITMNNEKIKIDNLFMPLYGATLLAAYAGPVIEHFNLDSEINVLYGRIGFHDLQQLNLLKDSIEANEHKVAPEYHIKRIKELIKGKNTLVIDDNVGYGLTLGYCKRMVESYGGNCYTRTPETSWERIRENNLELKTDFPGVSNYLRYTQQCEFIECLMEKGIYDRQLEYTKSENKYIDITQLDEYNLTELQKARIVKEREVEDIMNYSCNIESKYFGNRINIDVQDGKCTANKDLVIDEVIEKNIREKVDICIVDLNKSISGNSSNDIERFLQKYPDKLWIGGGITSVEEAEALIKKGAKGIVVGSLLYHDEKIDEKLIDCFIDRVGINNVCFSVDFYEDKIVTRGFEDVIQLKLHDVLKVYDKKAKDIRVILVDVNASKNQAEIDFEKIERINEQYNNIHFCYGGNINGFEQINKLNTMGIGAILGKNYFKEGF